MPPLRAGIKGTSGARQNATGEGVPGLDWSSSRRLQRRGDWSKELVEVVASWLGRVLAETNVLGEPLVRLLSGSKRQLTEASSHRAGNSGVRITLARRIVDLTLMLRKCSTKCPDVHLAH